MPELKIYDQRALAIIAEMKASGYKTPFIFERIDVFKTNVSSIKAGKRSFTVDQLINLSQLSGASMDWICGFSSLKMRVTIKK